jgi:hypothetical protein
MTSRVRTDAELAQHRRGAMAEGSTTTTADEARRMLDIFASVGAHAVDVTTVAAHELRGGAGHKMLIGPESH